MTDKPRLIDVALPLPIDDLFTYHVPPEFYDAIEPGMRAIVPLPVPTTR